MRLTEQGQIAPSHASAGQDKILLVVGDSLKLTPCGGSDPNQWDSTNRFTPKPHP
jgi:hypothetical protein